MMDYEISHFDGEQRLPDTAPARYAFGRIIGATALWDWEDEATGGEIDEFRLRFRNKAGATVTVYCNQAHAAALHADIGALLAKFADALAEPVGVELYAPTNGDIGSPSSSIPGGNASAGLTDR